jgi:uncharacterized membrane protein YhfC
VVEDSCLVRPGNFPRYDRRSVVARVTVKRPVPLFLLAILSTGALFYLVNALFSRDVLGAAVIIGLIVITGSMVYRDR